jgi:hypothetical protein
MLALGISLLYKGGWSPLLLLAFDRAASKDVLHVIVMCRVVLVGIPEMVDARLWRIYCPAIIILILSLGFAIWILQKQNLVLAGRVLRKHSGDAMSLPESVPRYLEVTWGLQEIFCWQFSLGGFPHLAAFHGGNGPVNLFRDVGAHDQAIMRENHATLADIICGLFMRHVISL